jgi:large subunit ribosomal protein L27Ae
MPTHLSKTRKHRGHVSAGNGRVGKHRKHPGGRGLAGGQHHHRYVLSPADSSLSLSIPLIHHVPFRGPRQSSLPFACCGPTRACADSPCSTNFDKYHPGYFGKVGMRHFHITRNLTWRPTINIEKLWALVPKEEKEGLTEGSDVVPVIDLLHHGYAKLLGNGQCVFSLLASGMALMDRLGFRNCPSSSRLATSPRSPSEFQYAYFVCPALTSFQAQD